ncbi:probable mechanosensitive ion channel protein 10 [Coccomyxa sp. Obi]|nr:probable mechanosensitive ion channel protein 10 [Coccomyxa sp. Obi]
MDSQDATAVALEEVVVAGANNQQNQQADIRGSNGIVTGGQTAQLPPSNPSRGSAQRPDSLKSAVPAEARSQSDFPGGDDVNTRVRQAKAAPSGADAASTHRLAADSRRSSHDNRRRPTPKDGVPSTPARSEDDFQFNEDLEDEPKAKTPFWRKWKFYRTAFLLLTSFALIVAGVLLRVLNRNGLPTGKNAPPINAWQRFKAEVHDFELWRWFFFFGGLAPIWWFGDFVVRLLVFLVESAFLNTKNVMYFLVAIRKPFGHFVRAVLLMPLYVPLFSPKAYASGTASTIYVNVLKAIGCLILFTFANVLSTLLAKMMASHFHKATHFHKMQEAIRKEYYLSQLSAPRPGRGPRQPFSSDVDLAKMGSVGGEYGSGSDGEAALKRMHHTSAAAFSNQLYNALVAPVAKVLPSGPSRAASAPLNFSFHSGTAGDLHMPNQAGKTSSTISPPSQPPRTTPDAPATGLTFSNPLTLPPVSAPPIRVPPSAVGSPQGPTLMPPRPQAGGPPTPKLGKEHPTLPNGVDAAPPNPPIQERDPHIDPTTDDYYGPGNAEKVAAARERARRKLAGASSRDSFTTAAELTPGGASRVPDDEEVTSFTNEFGPLPQLSVRSSQRRLYASSPFSRKEVERSDGSRQKLLNPLTKEGSVALPKFTSISLGQQKFTPEDLIVETIANSEKPPDLREGDVDGKLMAARLHAVEKHLRKNPLQGGTFVDKLQRSTSKKGFQEAAEKQAKRVAFYIYWNLKPFTERKYLVAEDFEEVLPLEQSREAFRILDRDGNGKLTPKELCQGVCEIFRERTNLAIQLKDTKTVVGRLKFVISIVLHILFAFFYLTIYNVDIQKVWLLFSSVVLAFAFVFGNSIRQLYEAVIFLFVIHPYDVGDWLLMGTSQYQVEEISLATTTIRGTDNVRQYYSNTKMIGASIVNLTRSDNKFEIFTVPVGLGTPSHIVDVVTKRVDEHLSANRLEFTGDRIIVFKDITNTIPIRMQLLVAVQMTHTGADIGRTLRARSAILTVVNDTLQEMGVFKDGELHAIVGAP